MKTILSFLFKQAVAHPEIVEMIVNAIAQHQQTKK